MIRDGNLARRGPTTSKQYYVYILTNEHCTVLYTGVTNNLQRRIYEHRENILIGFSSRYKYKKLVYYEVCNNIETALMRGKQIKAGPRSKKVELITVTNREWNDLYDFL